MNTHTWLVLSRTGGKFKARFPSGFTLEDKEEKKEKKDKNSAPSMSAALF